MKRPNALLPLWPLLWTLILGCLSHALAAGTGPATHPFQLQHDGLLKFTKPAASMRGIGKTLMRHEDFELSVDGQFQMIGSSRLIRLPGSKLANHIQTEPVCVSIVAIGKVQLKLSQTGKTFSAGTAVYRVSERSWILDGAPLLDGSAK